MHTVKEAHFSSSYFYSFMHASAIKIWMLILPISVHFLLNLLSFACLNLFLMFRFNVLYSVPFLDIVCSLFHHQQFHLSSTSFFFFFLSLFWGFRSPISLAFHLMWSTLNSQSHPSYLLLTLLAYISGVCHVAL